jgi:hypothetical protein
MTISISVQGHALLAWHLPANHPRHPMLTRALEDLHQELWASGRLCPPERAVMLTATSKRVRALLAWMNLRLPASVSVHCAIGPSRRPPCRACARGVAWVALDMSGVRAVRRGCRGVAGGAGDVHVADIIDT